MKRNSLFLPTLLLIIVATIAILFRPILIIDETRYISVAWEMYESGNYFVPTLNGVPYDHKPPLLFWLINLNWAIFGINESGVRFIPLIFAIGLVFVGYRIYNLLWKEDRYGAYIFPWILVGTTLFSYYSTLLMFDLMLSFWVALAVYAGLKASIDNRLSSYILLSFAIGFGILAKSPVIIAHLLPLYIFAIYWSEGRVRVHFYLKGFLSLLAGISIALIWAIPAAKMGGDKFAYGIFWGQYAGRVVDSFAHKKPFWWYLPWIPAILMPWILYRGFWSGFAVTLQRELDRGLKFILVWLVGALVIFSTISGKQLAYIAPELLGFVLLITRFLSLQRRTYKPIFISLLYIVISIVIFLIPKYLNGYYAKYIDNRAIVGVGITILIYGIYLLFKKYISKESVVKSISFGSILLIITAHILGNQYLKEQDLNRFSQELSKLQKEGIKIAHIGKYHDQFHFFGRLDKPLIEINNQNELKEFIKKYPNGAIITYKKRDEKFNRDATITTSKFRTRTLILINSKKWNNL